MDWRRSDVEVPKAMTYVVVAVTEIMDPEMLGDYAKQAKATMAPYGGEYVAVDDNAEAVEGSWPNMRTVIVTFPSAEAARKWYESPKYQRILPLRLRSVKADVVLVRGLAETKAAKAT